MILLTGGSGRLGTALRGLIECDAPSHAEFDVTDPKWVSAPDLIVHCAAYTNLMAAQTDEHSRRDCYRLNVLGTEQMTKFPLVYISTEYVFDGKDGNYPESASTSPLNHYAATKAIGESVARLAPRSLVIRCLFKERPYRHAEAPVNQWTSGDYVDVIAPMVAQCIKWFEAGHFKQHDTIHVGTGRKATIDLARQTRNVTAIALSDINMPLPADTSLDCSRYYGMAKELAHGY